MKSKPEWKLVSALTRAYTPALIGKKDSFYGTKVLIHSECFVTDAGPLVFVVKFTNELV